LTLHVRGTRESLHGDVCVVGKFALAYQERIITFVLSFINISLNFCLKYILVI